MTDYSALLVALARGGVRFVMIGGAAAIAHESARLTKALDVVYARDRANVERLAAALAPLTTTVGDFDALGEVIGGGGYEDLVPGSVEMTAFGVTFRCVSLEKLIALKRAAGRPKDLEAIAELEALRDESKPR